MTKLIKEGGNIWPDQTKNFDHTMIPGMMKQINSVARQTGAKVLPIGSGATPVPGKISGDLDMIVDAGVLKKYFKIDPADKNANKNVKIEFEKLFQQAGFETRKTGQIVHVKVPMGDHAHQVDIMVVDDGAAAQKFHVHDIPANSPYKGVHKQIAMAYLSKAAGMKWSPYKGLVNRDTNELVSNNLDEIAKRILNPNASAKDLGSLESIMAALKPDAAQQMLTDLKANNPAQFSQTESQELNRIKQLSGL